MIPDGPTERVAAATRIATAAGSSRRVAIARSTEHHVSSTPAATIGSGRKPLLYGSHTARKPNAPVHRAIRPVRAATPNRGTTSRLSTSHVTMPASNAGRRTHGLALQMSSSRPKM